MLNRIKSFCYENRMSKTEIEILIQRLNEIPNGIQRYYDDINHRNSLRRVRNLDNTNKNN